MTITGTQHLNQYVAKFFLEYLKKVSYSKTGSPDNNFAWLYFHLSDIPWSSDSRDMSALPEDAALFLRKRVLGNEPRSSMRHIVQDEPDLRPLVNHGAQSWLIFTYLQTLQKIHELDKGILKYGPNNDLYRVIEENVIAARLMFAEGTIRLAAKIFDRHKGTPNLGLVEGGAGNGAAMFTILKTFHKHHIFPDFLVTDIDLITRGKAETYFRDHGFPSKHFPWAQIDIGDPKHLAQIADYFPWHNLVFNINFIIHEHESIAEKFFESMSKSLPNAELIVSEFFLPEGYPNCAPDPDFPWWFVALHHLSGQHLRTRSEFLTIAEKYGYCVLDELVHQTHNGQPVTSTLFLRKV